MKTPKLLTALAALTSVFALSACGNDKTAEQPQAEAQIEQPRMVVFLRMQGCAFSHLMKTEMDAAQSSNPAAMNGITAIDVSTPEGYAAMQNFSIDGQPITQAPAMVVLRGNQIIDGQVGQMHVEQMQQRLQAAHRDHFARDTRIPQAARITLGS